ncbi:MAG: molybdenum cofactor guanylyltransferase [Spirochaetaceae bacterium]|jgi:molybdopterin-guanine dinucleotide biosynthesis protein A|nr:molybdenum cofactor guanylyltransferase [Spirochaetaceae bacterium]
MSDKFQAGGGAAIIAGGMGRRIGYDKKRLLFEGEYIINRQIETLAEIFNEIIVSTNNPFVHEKARSVNDILGSGPLAGIYSALSASACDWLFVCACDMPFISLNYIRHLIRRAGGNFFDVCAVVRENGFIEPFNALYHKHTLPILERNLRTGEYKAQAALSAMPLIAVTPEEAAYAAGGERDIFYNINYEEDLRHAAYID